MMTSLFRTKIIQKLSSDKDVKNGMLKKSGKGFLLTGKL